MLGSVKSYSKRYPADFAAGSKAAELMAIALAGEAEATGSGTEQASGDGKTRAGTVTKAGLYDGLLEDLRAISGTAKSISSEMAGLDEKFRLPRSQAQSVLLTTARAFLKDATPLAANFIAYELAADFLTDLEDDIAAYDAAEDDQDDGLGKRVGATRTIAQALTDGCAAVRNLEPLMRNKYKNDPPKLAEWFVASHVERAPRKAKPVPPVA